MSETEKRPTIIQFWHDAAPKDVSELLAGWRALEPKFDYRLYDDASARRLLADNFAARVLNAYDSCALPAMRSDLFRYCALYLSGGIYVDADMKLVGDLAGLYASTEYGLLAVTSLFGQILIPNGFIIVKQPGDPLMKYCADRAVENIETRSSNRVEQVTGPWILTDLYRSDWPERALLESYEIVPQPRIVEVVRTIRLEYKKDGGHWSQQQEMRSIFAYKKDKGPFP